MTFQHFVRRAHLYMGLCLWPWVVMFGVSSIPLNHNLPSDPPKWIETAQHSFDVDLPPVGETLRPLGRQMMDTTGITGGYFVNRVNQRQVNVNHPNFLRPVRIIYQADQKRLITERREFTLRSFVSGMHTRGGYDLDGAWDSVWAVFVDIVSVALLVWMASGVYMWWYLPVTRRWGWAALAAGAASFAVIVFSL